MWQNEVEASNVANETRMAKSRMSQKLNLYLNFI